MNRIRYYKKNELVLKPDVPGARMWAVALKKSMLTYFQIDPNSEFSMHSHKSEQITMVLEGKLFFRFMNGKNVCLRKGEVIAIPSDVKHSVYTRKEPVKAIDAWSPIRKEYR